MSYKTMESLKDMLCEELDEIVETGHIGTSELDIVHKITDTIKNVDKIETLEDEGYSYGDWRANGSYGRSMNGTYDNGSYARGRSYGRHYVRGHYSNSSENMMLADKMDEMIKSNNSMSAGEKETLKRAIDMLR